MIFQKVISLFSRGFVKLVVMFSHCYEWAYLNKLKSEMQMIGTNASIKVPISILSPQYISIGCNFTSRERLKLRAFSQFQGQKFKPEIFIGDNVSIETDCHIGCVNRVVIGNNVLIASHVFISDHSHGLTDYSDIDIPPLERKLSSKSAVVIEDNVWIGEMAVILSGVTIGQSSIIGANAVVTKSVPPYSVVAGNPARVIKKVMPNL